MYNLDYKSINDLNNDLKSCNIDFKNFFVDKFLKSILLPNETYNFIEIGALDGDDSYYFSKKFPKSNIYCIEGSTEVYKSILSKKNYDFKIFNTCIFNYNGKVSYHLKKTKNEGLFSGIHGVYNRGNIYGIEVETVECKTLDKFCEEENLLYIDVAKIDVEGATFDILNNMDMLSKIKIMHIETEDYPFFENQKLDKEVCKLLNDKNFKCLFKTGFSPEYHNGKQYDSVWINLDFFNITNDN
jgi:FkbM family methyltransferase